MCIRTAVYLLRPPINDSHRGRYGSRQTEECLIGDNYLNHNVLVTFLGEIPTIFNEQTKNSVFGIFAIQLSLTPTLLFLLTPCWPACCPSWCAPACPWPRRALALAGSSLSPPPRGAAAGRGSPGCVAAAALPAIPRGQPAGKAITVLRIQEVYPGSRIRLFSIPDPHKRI